MKRFYFFLIAAILFFPPLIFFTDLTRNPFSFQIVLLNGLTVFLWIVWLIHGLINKKLLIRKTPLDIPLLSFVVIATVSLFAAFLGNLDGAFLRMSILSEGAKRWLFLIVNSVFVFYAAVYFTDDENRGTFINILFLAGFIAAFYSILQYFGIEPIWPYMLNPFAGRSVSTFGNPTFLSSYVVMLFAVAAPIFLREKKTNPVLFVLLVTLFLSLVCTMTRSSWAGFVAVCVMICALIFIFEKPVLMKKIKIIVFVLTIFIGAAVFMPGNVTSGGVSAFGRVAEVSQAREGYYAPLHQRFLIWSCAFHMVIEYPLLGRGWGCFELFYPFYQGRHLFLDMYRNFRTHANNAHNEILEIWSQTGTIGFGIYIWFLCTLFFYGFFLIKNLKGEKKFIAIGLLSALFGMLTDNLLNVSMNFPIPGFLYWWIAGMLVGLGTAETKEVKLNTFAKMCVILILSAAGFLLIYRYSRDFLAEVYFFKGYKASKSNDLTRGARFFERSYGYKKYEVNNNYELGNIYARMGISDKAIKYYEEALRSNAGYDEIYFNMANMYNQKGMIEKAKTLYTSSLNINPVSKEGYVALGGIFMQDIDKYCMAGIKLLEQSVIFNKDDKDIWNNLGFLYAKQGMHEKALEAYKKALQLDPGFEMARRNAAVTLAQLKEYDFAGNSDTLFMQAESEINLKNWQKVLAISKKLVQVAPGSIKANLYLANALFSVGRVEEAIGQYNKTLQIDSNNEVVMGNLVAAYMTAGKYDMAKEVLERILRINPGNNLAKQKLDEIHSIMGKK